METVVSGGAPGSGLDGSSVIQVSPSLSSALKHDTALFIQYG